MPKPANVRDDLWFEHDYDPVVNGLYQNKTVRVIHVEAPLTAPIRPPHAEAAPGTMQTIPIDQALAHCDAEKTSPSPSAANGIRFWD